MFTKPKIYSNNILRDAQTGDDGTSYATCSAAVADAADPFKVRGNIEKSEDISLLSTLEGCGVVFNATQNRYTIVDSRALGEKLASQGLIPALSPVWDALVVGSYLYVTVMNSPAVLMKINLVAMTMEGYLQFPVGSLAMGITVNDDETILYVGFGTSPGIVVPVTLSNFSVGDYITLLAGEDVIYDVLFYDGAVFCACSGTPGKIVKIDAGTHERVGVLDLSAGENNPRRLALSGTSILACCYTAAGIVVKFDPAPPDPIRQGAVTLNAGENNLTSITALGTDVYVCCNVSPGIVVKIDATPATPTRTSARTLNAGENGCICIGTDGTDLYTGCSPSPGIVVKLDPVAMTRTSAVSMAANEDSVYALGFYGSSLYPICNTGHIVKVNPAAMTRTSGFLPAGGENQVRAVAVIGNYLYAALYLTPAKIVKFNLTTMTRVSALDLNAGEDQVISLTVVGQYLLAVCYAAPTIIVKIDPNAMSRMGALTLNAGEQFAVASCAYGTNLMVGCGTSPAIIVKVNTVPAAPTRTSVMSLNAGENNPGAMLLYGSDVLVGCQTTPGIVVKMNPAAMTRTSARTLSAGENNIASLCLVGSALFAGCNTTAGIVVKLDPAAMTRTGSLTLDAGENNVRSLATDNGYLFAACYVAPGIIVTIYPTPANPVKKASVPLDTGENYPYGLTRYGEDIVCGLYTSPGKIVKVATKLNLTLFERLQETDIGDSFTVRAGFACAQASTSRPVLYASDGSRAPRFTGLVNTALYLRAHAPNFCQDGGFESGVFLPNWTAEAGWTVISSASKLEGAYSASWDLVASKYLMQTMTGKLVKGRTYTILFKAQSTTANPTAGAIIVTAKQTGSNADIDSDQAGYQPAITTAVTWFNFDVTADFTTNNWYIKIAGDHTKANGATAVVIDEVYIYEKKTVNSLILGYHNLIGKAVTVNAWRLSPLRSTSAVDANNKAVIGNAVTVDTADVFLSTLTTSTYPVIEIYIPATATFTPELGEAYLGDYWQLPNFLKGPLDPYRTNADGLIEQTWTVTNINPALRTTTIEALFEKLRSNEAVWCQWDTEAPILMESPRDAREAPYSPYRTDMTVKLLEKL